MRRLAARLLGSQASGLLLVIIALSLALALCAGTHTDRRTGRLVNNFLNRHTLLQTATDASFFAIMAVGATLVIIAGGIDLSVGAVYSLAGVTMALTLRRLGPLSPLTTVACGLALSLGVGALAGLLNGLMIVGLPVHPFIITLGTMWIFRGLAFVASRAESILLPDALTAVVKLPLGAAGLYPIPMLTMLVITALGAVYLSRTVMGRHIYAVGGNPEASRYAGLPIARIRVGVYVVAGLCAGIAAFLGSGFYGAASCADATGYELYVIASAVVGGASLSGGRGGAGNAMLGALLIVLMRQSIRTLRVDQNYEWIIIGAAIVVAVVLDQLNARLALRRLLRKPDMTPPTTPT